MRPPVHETVWTGFGIHKKLFDFYKTATSRSDLVASFLAILELAKDKSIYLTGDGEDIQIELLEGNENTW